MHHSRLQYRLSLSVLSLGLLSGGHAIADCLVHERAHLSARDQSNSRWFGRAVAIDGSIAVVGAPSSLVDGEQLGSAHVYRFDGVEWREEATLVPDASRRRVLFGYNVAIAGSHVLIAALQDDDAGTNAGAVYVFRAPESPGGEWVREAKLLAPDPDLTTGFGRAMQLSGKTLLIGSLSMAYVFRLDEFRWIQEARLEPPEGANGFGQAVALAHNIALVGAKRERSQDGQFGAAYLYRRSGGVWAQVARFRPPAGGNGRSFGDSVAVSDRLAIIGDSSNYNSRGAAFVYRSEDERWVLEEKLVPGGYGGSDYFGKSVAVVGDTIFVGAPHDDGDKVDSGSAHVFRRRSDMPGGWQRVAKLSARVDTLQGHFGGSLSVSGDRLLVGAEDYFPGPGSGQGAAFLFRGLTSDCNANGQVDLLDLGSCVSPDCNVNCAPDECDIADGTSEDANNSGIPDECEGACCAADATCREDVPIDQCDGRFTAETLCADLKPPCVHGACCGADGICVDALFQDECEGAYHSETLCEELQPPCMPMGACCGYDGICQDDAFRDDCAGRFTEDARCEELDPECVWICPATEFASILPESSQPGARFGASVATSGRLGVVGAPLDDELGEEAGAAYVIEKRDGIWFASAKLMAFDGGPDDWFGGAVAISGETIVVGASYAENRTGAVYVFQLQGDEWTATARLLASDPETGDWFGEAVALHGEYLFVGAPYDELDGNNGVVYVFRKAQDQWQEFTRLTGPRTRDSSTAFGRSLAFSGNMLAVGAPGWNGLGTVYQFTRDEESWEYYGMVVASDGERFDRFGSSVAIAGDWLLVGAPGASGVESSSGAAYLYRPEGWRWIQDAKITAFDGVRLDDFGSAVAIEDNIIMIGAFDDSYGRGAAYVYMHDGQFWVDSAKLTVSGAPGRTELGISIDFTEGTALIGAPRAIQGALAGAVHTFPSLADCTENDRLDTCDLLGGVSLDCNGTGIPDECEQVSDGDFDSDGDVDLDDFEWFIDCMAGPQQPPRPADPQCAGACRASFDCDLDGDVDAEDFAGLARLFRR